MEKSCGAFVIDSNKVLMVKQNRGHYSFPKGHVETGETEFETAIREVKEETNVDIEIISDKRYRVEYYTSENNLKEVIFFIAKPLNYDIKKEEIEISEVIWVDKNEVIDTLTYENMKDLWKKVLKDI